MKEGSARLGDLLQRQLGQPLPLPLGRKLRLPLEQGPPDSLHHIACVGKSRLSLVDGRQSPEKVWIGIPVAPVTDNLFPDKEAVLDGAVKILPGHKPIHHGLSPRGILPARRMYIRPQIAVCGAQLHKAFPLSAHLRRFLHDDLPQAAIENLGSPHHSGIQVKGVPQHLIGVFRKRFVGEKRLQQAQRHHIPLLFRIPGAFLLEIGTVISVQELLQPLPSRLIPAALPHQVTQGVVVLIGCGEHQVVALELAHQRPPHSNVEDIIYPLKACALFQGKLGVIPVDHCPKAVGHRQSGLKLFGGRELLYGLLHRPTQRLRKPGVMKND